MKFFITNSTNVKTLHLAENHVLISITDGHRDPPELESNKNRKAILFLNFDDVDETEMSKWTVVQYSPMSRSQARKILDFIDVFKDDISLIVCQCGAGISRSPAVAAALAKIFNGDDAFIFDNPYYKPNMHVYKLILQENYNNKL